MTALAIIMPAYNADRFIGEAIASVVAQSIHDWQLVIVDDGSTDQTRKIAEQFASIDQRIRVVRQLNRGIAHAMNRGLDEVKCDLVACMHADDVMRPNRLERQMEFASRHPDVAVFSSLVEWIDQSGRSLGLNRSDLTTTDDVRRAIEAGRCVAFPHPAVMFRREIIQRVGGYRQDFFPAEDTELWNRVVANGHLVLVQPEVLLSYRIHSTSASMSRAHTMVKRLRWIEACAAAWRSGSEEPSWEAFLDRRRSLAWHRRFGQWRRDASRTLYQVAIGHQAARHRFACGGTLALAACLEPELILNRMYGRLQQLFARPA